ncbi:Nuclear receptor coactivator 1 [Melipona quadrifasciata]|uniref:Nuclear receptor coactivator 1 n=1 Tax=Melipona quadrifasciata TaxID=166423 RepID=A0A0N0BH93_9HYME|nr:Nuclear receptor coactivator 1 [Melipona quadrifasciata]
MMLNVVEVDPFSNKCLNEKRRRNQENLFIDELAELVSATDMSSGKTDKCQILQRAVDQFAGESIPEVFLIQKL